MISAYKLQYIYVTYFHQLLCSYESTIKPEMRIIPGKLVVYAVGQGAGGASGQYAFSELGISYIVERKHYNPV